MTEEEAQSQSRPKPSTTKKEESDRSDEDPPVPESPRITQEDSNPGDTNVMGCDIFQMMDQVSNSSYFQNRSGKLNQKKGMMDWAGAKIRNKTVHDLPNAHKDKK